MFKLVPSASGYSKSVLYKFRGGDDGSVPDSLTIDAAGALYGVTDFGGGTTCAAGYGCGILFKLTPSASGFSERVLWSFGKGTDGYYPQSNVFLGPRGKLYGTAWQGGTHYAGTLYELVPAGSGYTEKVLINYDGGVDGGDPRGNLIADVKGRIFGTTYVGGSSQFDGTVFRFTP